MTETLTRSEVGARAFTPIADYGLLSDCHTAALVSREGSIDWLCAPRFDSPSVFARLLDRERGGHFSVRPQGDFQVERSYLEGTNVIETLFTTATGRLALHDFLALEAEGQLGRAEVYQHGVLMRLLRCVHGQVPVRIEIAARPDYGRERPRFRRGAYADRGEFIEVLGPGLPCYVSSDREFSEQGGDLVAEFTLGELEEASVAFRYAGQPANTATPEIVHRLLEVTVRGWRDWFGRLRYDGPHADLVARSALVLKALVYHDSGALIAAPTTSLPEALGGERNWDYRYSWSRDSSFMLLALMSLNYEREGRDYIEFLRRASRGAVSPPLMQGIGGELELDEQTLDHLAGYAGSRPVRLGNGAHDQLQLDTYGDVLDASWAHYLLTSEMDPEDWDYLRYLVEFACSNWERPDNGLWEVRGGLQHFTHSKVMCWVAVDRGIRLAEEAGLDADLDRWKHTRDAIRERTLREGYDERRNTFVQAYGSQAVDASSLRFSLVGFVEGHDPRMIGTIDRVIEELAVDGLVYRYRVSETDDGLAGGEGTFGICSFWLCAALALAGRQDEARERFDRLAGLANELGLYSEELAPDGVLLGNFPQAFTHLALIHAALFLDHEDHDLLEDWTRRGSPWGREAGL